MYEEQTARTFIVDHFELKLKSYHSGCISQTNTGSASSVDLSLKELSHGILSYFEHRQNCC